MTPPPSDHFNGKTFFYPRHPVLGRHTDLLRWKLTSRPARWPDHVPLDVPAPSAPPVRRADEIVATWIGHSTYLLQTAHGNFLTDPVFSDRVSPVTWAGPRRVHPPGLAFEDLPRIDVVLLSHDHYDHCDIATLRRLATTHDPLFVAPLRHRDLLTSARAHRIAELDWWESHTLSALAPTAVSSPPTSPPSLPSRSIATLTLTPARHWSNRLGTPRNHRLWGGFMLTLPATPTSRQIWFAGDSGYDDTLFSSIRARCGAPDLALIPIGAYEPRWFMAPMHMNPAEAVQTHRDVGARQSLAMHWGTVQLTDEGRDAPPLALAAARTAAGLPDDAFKVLAPGASLTV